MALVQYIRGNQGVSSSNLPFFLKDVRGSAPAILQTNKDIILSDFLKGFKQVNSDVPQLKSMTKEQLRTLLNQWNSKNSGSLGEELGNNIANYIDKQIVTGAGIQAAFEAAINDNNIRNINNPAQRATAAAEEALKIITDKLTIYKDILKQVEEPALLMKVLEIHDSFNKPYSDPDLNKYNGRILSEAEKTRLSTKVSNNFSTLQDVVHTLQALSKGTYSLDGKDPIQTVKSLMKTATGCFGAVGGEGIHEIIGEHAANIVKTTGEDEVVNKTTSLFQQSGGKVSGSSNLGHNVGELGTKMAGKQLKPDIEIWWDINGVTINLPVSMKARQSTSNYTVGGKTIGTVRPQGIQLGELLAMTLNSTASTKWYEQGLGAVLHTPSKNDADLADAYQPFIESWNEFKKAAKYTALFRALVGTGITGDFAALFIVNDTVFSVYDILNNADNSTVIRWGTGYNGKDLGIPDFDTMVSQVGGKYRDSDGKIPTHAEAGGRISEEQGWIKALWNTKIYIEIQLTNLSKSL